MRQTYRNTVRECFRLGSKVNQNLPPAVLSDGNTVAWYDYQKNVVKDGANAVSEWGDKINGNKQIQEDGTKQPLWTENGIVYDGLDNLLVDSSFTYSHPVFVYIVAKTITHASFRAFFSSYSTTVGVKILFRNSSTTGNIYAYAGINSQEATVGVSNLFIARILFNGATSKLIANDQSSISGDFGSFSFQDFATGGISSLSGYLNCMISEIIIRDVADNATDEAAIYAYLKKKYEL